MITEGITVASTNQEYWDASLIRTWRNAGTVMDAIRMYQSITKTDFVNDVPSLKRVPKLGYPWKMGIRTFVASYLSKISNRLWDQPQEKDVLLLRKLKTSSYDTDVSATPDSELQKEQRASKVNNKKMEFANAKYKQRNSSTDWNVNKGPR